MSQDKRFPIQRTAPDNNLHSTNFQEWQRQNRVYNGDPYDDTTRRHVPGTISWALAEKAFAAYQAEGHRSQSLQRLAERGGFSHAELEDWLGLTAEEINADFQPHPRWKKATP